MAEMGEIEIGILEMVETETGIVIGVEVVGPMGIIVPGGGVHDVVDTEYTLISLRMSLFGR